MKCQRSQNEEADKIHNAFFTRHVLFGLNIAKKWHKTLRTILQYTNFQKSTPLNKFKGKYRYIRAGFLFFGLL